MRNAVVEGVGKQTKRAIHQTHRDSERANELNLPHCADNAQKDCGSEINVVGARPRWLSFVQRSRNSTCTAACDQKGNSG